MGPNTPRMGLSRQRNREPHLGIERMAVTTWQDFTAIEGFPQSEFTGRIGLSYYAGGTTAKTRSFTPYWTIKHHMPSEEDEERKLPSRCIHRDEPPRIWPIGHFPCSMLS
jgi:hypothetical protein